MIMLNMSESNLLTLRVAAAKHSVDCMKKYYNHREEGLDKTAAKLAMYAAHELCELLEDAGSK